MSTLVTDCDEMYQKKFDSFAQRLSSLEAPAHKVDDAPAAGVDTTRFDLTTIENPMNLHTSDRRDAATCKSDTTEFGYVVPCVASSDDDQQFIPTAEHNWSDCVDFTSYPEAQASESHAPASDDLVDKSLPMCGDTVLIQDLVKASQYNGKFGVMGGFDKPTGRCIIKLSPNIPPLKVKLCNISFPALCPECDAEVTSSGCFACGYGLASCASKDQNIRNAAASGDPPPDIDTTFQHGRRPSEDVMVSSTFVNSCLSESERASPAASIKRQQ